MIRKALHCIFLFLFSLAPTFSFAEEENLTYFPSYTLFQPLLADNREPQTGFIPISNNKFVGAIGKSFDLIQWKLSNRDAMSWGITGVAFVLLNHDKGSFPMHANDWQFGTYLNYIKQKFYHRLEFAHNSAHLGDSLFDEKSAIIYSREFFRWITTYCPDDSLKLYLGIGSLTHSIPNEKPLFAQGGVEFFSNPFKLFFTNPQFYTAYDVKYKEEAGGVVNHSMQAGLAFMSSDEKSRNALRIGLVYFDGNNEFGQFYQEKESYWGMGIFFDL